MQNRVDRIEHMGDCRLSLGLGRPVRSPLQHGLREFEVPVPWEELDEAGLWRVGDAGEDVGEPGLRIDVVEFCGLDERVHNGGPLGTTLRSRK